MGLLVLAGGEHPQSAVEASFVVRASVPHTCAGRLPEATARTIAEPKSLRGGEQNRHYAGDPRQLDLVGIGVAVVPVAGVGPFLGGECAPSLVPPVVLMSWWSRGLVVDTVEQAGE